MAQGIARGHARGRQFAPSVPGPFAEPFRPCRTYEADTRRERIRFSMSKRTVPVSAFLPPLWAIDQGGVTTVVAQGYPPDDASNDAR